METKRSPEVAPKDVEYARGISENKLELPPWLFRHQCLEDSLEDAQAVEQKDLKNMFNHIHFKDGTLYVHLRDLRYKEGILLKACPEPCLDEELTCKWYHHHSSISLLLENYRFLNLLMDDGQSLILVPAIVLSMNNESFTVRLPDKGYAVGRRQARRYPCHNVDAELIQSGFQATGELLDFNKDGFRIKVTPGPNNSFRWLNSDESVQIHLKRDQQIIFSGTCRYIRKGSQLSEKEIVLAPDNTGIKRFKKKRARNLRQRLCPSPTLHFEHPLLQRKVQVEVHDISTSGFCVYEAEEMKVLMPGMIIPELSISFSGALQIKCSAQVIYRLNDDEGGRYGLAILDMGINAYSRLTQILTNVLEPHAHVSGEVDMDALWEFFFETGFIYPKKYRLIQAKRDIFQETYGKLYQENPEIAKHFTYQKNGRIYGHISIIRAYERAWMMHHHAARAAGNKRTGFIVLKQLMHYLNDMHRLPSSGMDYAISYFRPENKFPDRVFGGFARELNEPRGCSMDLFAYLSHTSLSLGTQLPEMWSLKRSSAFDIWNFRRFYEQSSRGLFLDALGLEQKNESDETLEALYARLGFLRKWRAYSLVNKGELNALLIVNQSDLGINLSDLLSSVKVLVTNPDGLPYNILSIAVSKLTGEYRMNRVPVLFYPFEYVLDKEIPYEKTYQMWILNVEYGNEYMEYMRKRFRVGYR